MTATNRALTTLARFSLMFALLAPSAFPRRSSSKRSGQHSNHPARVQTGLDDAETRTRMGDAAVDAYRHRFTVEAMVDAHMALYAELAEKAT